MDWPLYFKKQLILGNPNSNIAITTLWTPKDTVTAELDPQNFSVCGQLYTKRGINFIIRNIWANPKIRHLIICGNDRQKSGEALVRFFENGVEEESGKSGDLKGWKVIGDDEALIDKEIPLEDLNTFRESVTIHDLRNLSSVEVKKKIKDIEKLGQTESFAEAKEFEEAETLEVAQYPSDLSVFKIRREYIGDAWLDALQVVTKFGSTVPGMYGDVKQVHNLSIIVENEDPQTPKIYDFFRFNKEGLESYYEGFFNKNEDKEESYTYGERIFDWDGIDQEKIMVEKLTRFPSDRGAMAVLWKPHVDNFPPKKTEVTKDGQTKGWRVPCLVMISAQCMENKLYMTAVFRNNDICGAWPLNAFALRLFQQKIAKKIGANLGPLTTISQIAEIYELDWQSASEIVSENSDMARSCQYDTRGYYTVAVEENDIVVTFYTPDGNNVIGEFREDGKREKVARDLCAKAISEMLIENLGAAADLGRQLAKAETAVKLGLRFEQDKVLQPLK